MTVFERFEKLIKGKVVGLILHGKSIEELETNIASLTNYDICWASMNYFTIMEDFILSKINKHLSIVMDISDIPIKTYNKVRARRIRKFLARREDNMFLTKYDMIEEWFRINEGDIFENSSGKYMKIDNSLIPLVHNSLSIYLLTLQRYGAKKIILFGCDGYNGIPNEYLKSYYKTELIEQDRNIAFGRNFQLSLHSDSYTFDRQWYELRDNYAKQYNYIPCPIINCSPNTMFTCFPKIKYNQLIEEIEK